LEFYVRVCDPGFIVSGFHRALMQLLEEVASGARKRLIISVPPRHGKSRLVTQELPTWMFGWGRSINVICASHTSDLSTTHSRLARKRIESKEYAAAFPGVSIDPTSRASGDWSTTNGCHYRAVGVASSLTGHGADVLIIDDAHKDYEEAHNAAARDRVWQWFLSTAFTRLSSEGRILIIGTRWHSDDLIGRIVDPSRQAELAEAGIDPSEEWAVVNLPGIAEEGDQLGRKLGEALFPQLFPANKVNAIMTMIGDYLASAMYRGEPKVLGGNLMKAQNVIVVERDAVPAELRLCRFWDLATSEDDMAHFTAGALCGMDESGRFWILDITYGKWEWAHAKAVIAGKGEADGCMVGIEAVGGFKVAFSEVKALLLGKVPLKEVAVAHDKVTRAIPWMSATSTRQVMMVKASWNVEFMKEATEFPRGAYDDLVDSVSGAWHLLKTYRPVLIA